MKKLKRFLWMLVSMLVLTACGGEDHPGEQPSVDGAYYCEKENGAYELTFIEEEDNSDQLGIMIIFYDGEKMHNYGAGWDRLEWKDGKLSGILNDEASVAITVQKDGTLNVLQSSDKDLEYDITGTYDQKEPDNWNANVDMEDYSPKLGDNGVIDAVKHAKLTFMSTVTYGEAYDDFFGDPQWNVQEEEGNTAVIIFTGTCEVFGESADIKETLLYNKFAEEVTVQELLVNGEPQDSDMVAELLDTLEQMYGTDDTNTVDEADVRSDESDFYAQDYDWQFYFQREDLADAGMTIYLQDASGVTFSIGVNSDEGILADLRDCTAEWMSDTTALWEDSNSDYALTLNFQEDGTINVTENMDDPYGVNLAGHYLPDTEY